jgi:hypothetical protein
MTDEQWKIIYENIKWRCHLGGLQLKTSAEIAEDSINKAKKSLELHEKDLQDS